MPKLHRVIAVLAAAALLSADYRPPAGTRPVAVRRGASSVLPGGRIVTPLGKQYTTGPGPFGLAVNAKGDRVVTADGGPNRYALTFAERDKSNVWRVRHQVAPRNRDEEEDGDDADWRSVFFGLDFAGDRDLFVSEGNSGRVRLIDSRNGKRRQLYDLNQGGFRDSYTGDLAYDAAAQRLYVLDQANFRLVVIDTRQKKVVSSIRTGRLPFALALAPGGERVYVANIGMFEYSAIPGADRAKARETGLPFPAFGFPSPESAAGARRPVASGEEVAVPGLGDPNTAESNSVAVIDVSNALEPKLIRQIRTGRPFGNGVHGGSSPSGLTATAERVYVSNGNNDSITVIDAATLEVEKEIGLRINGLEQYRGVLPIGSAVDPHTGWLLVAAAGINAVVVIDTKTLQPLGLIPTAWFPTKVRIRESVVWVSCAKGHGTGPNANRLGPARDSFHGERRRGTLETFPLPDVSELARHTAQVFYNNGFVEAQDPPGELPGEIEHVVVIVKENRTFDEVFGDLEMASNGPVNGIPILARFGKWGVIQSPRGGLQQRLALRGIQVTPNHHALAARFAFSDNFYADSEVSVDGHHWLAGSYPNAWTESTLMAAYGGQKDFRLGTAPGRLLFPQSNSSVHPEEQLEAGALWHHLERHGIPFRNYGEGFELAGADEGVGLKPTGARYLTNVPMPDPLYRNTSRTYPNYNMNIPDQFRASQFIGEIEEMYRKPAKPLPRFLFIHLPNDHMARPRPEDGYPYDASFVADNDYALGRIVEYLSHSPWWRRMAIFVTEDDAQGGVDHIDSHRTLLMAISPYARRFHVSRVNTSFPGLLKTVFRLLRIPPLNLFDATAADLADCFTTEPDFTPYEKAPVAAEIFDPAKAKEPLDPSTPSPAMDDPRVLEQQHRDRRP
ncbi:MAG: bifunctional YncE family protein/alkaline phosphatase family protein [Bryobacteraceae bacterium]